MHDPHVESLTYRIVPGPNTAIGDPPALEVETELFRVAHFATVAEARAVVDPCVDGWTAYWALKGRGRFRFQFKSAHRVDRKPSPQGQVLEASPAEMVFVGNSAQVLLTHHRFPPPPPRFTLSPDLERLLRRFLRYRDGKDSLGAVVYFSARVLRESMASKASAYPTR